MVQQSHLLLHWQEKLSIQLSFKASIRNCINIEKSLSFWI